MPGTDRQQTSSGQLPPRIRCTSTVMGIRGGEGSVQES